MTVQIYVGTYAKYNNGSISGAWVDLEQYDNEADFAEHIAELHKDETDPEFMFQDYEGYPKAFYSESGIDSRIFEWLELDSNDREIVEAFLDCFGDCAGDVFSAATNAYYGSYDSDYDFAYELVDSCGELQGVSETTKNYFDYDKYANDLMISDFVSSNNRYFSSNW